MLTPCLYDSRHDQAAKKAVRFLMEYSEAWSCPDEAMEVVNFVERFCELFDVPFEEIRYGEYRVNGIEYSVDTW